MGKHIDSEKLKTEIERRRKFHDDAIIKFCNNRTIALTHSAGLKEDEEIVVLIDSFQQEQQDFPTTDEQVKEILATHPKVEVPNKYKTPDWLWKKQEQPEVDLEKAARHVYESWMGGTMDDVRRDMVELGKVLNARKED